MLSAVYLHMLVIWAFGLLSLGFTLIVISYLLIMFIGRWFILIIIIRNPLDPTAKYR